MHAQVETALLGVKLDHRPSLVLNVSIVAYTVWYFSGLNTYGDDRIHLGPIPLSLMHAKIGEGLKRRGVNLVPVQGLGLSPLLSQVERARTFIERHPKFIPGNDHHFLGHSIGGIIARILNHQITASVPIKTIIGIASPHRGTRAATWAKELLRRQPLRAALISAFGYSLRKRLDVFAEFSNEKMEQLNQIYKDRSGTLYASAVASKPFSDLSWPIWSIGYLVAVNSAQSDGSDGIIEMSSQLWGESLGHFQLDHLEQIGYCWSLNADRRNRARSEFERLLDSLVQFWEAHSQG